MGKAADIIERTLDHVGGLSAGLVFEPRLEELGVVASCADGVVSATGLPDVQSEEVVRLESGAEGLVIDLLNDRVGIVLLTGGDGVHAGERITRTGRVLTVPAGPGLLGRVIDPVGRPLDEGGPIEAEVHLAAERPAPGVLEREPVTVPLHTGLKVIDAMIPIGRGQRELVVGDRSIGKTAIAVDTILNQKGQDVICVYVAVGQKAASTGRVVEALKRYGAMEYTVVVACDAEDSPGLKYVAPYAGCAVGEYWRDRGRDALVIYDDLSRHADAYREISLLLKRPPGREAYPGDIFYIHSRLLERAARLDADHGGGSLTALPMVETQAGNISAFVPTNLISITDGQIYLESKLFQAGHMPPIDTGKSVSRVGGKTQLKAVKSVAGRLRLGYNQYVELEYFTRFGARIDDATRKVLERGKRLRRLLRQPQFDPVPIAAQVAVFLAAEEGVLDDLPEEDVPRFEKALRRRFLEEMGELAGRIETGGPIGDEDRRSVRALAESVRRGLSGDDKEEGP